MDSSGKRRSFLKVKLMPSIYRAVMPSPASHYASKVKSKPTPPATSSSVGYIVNQDLKPLAVQQVSMILSADDTNESISQVDNYFGAIADERVNMKAANYISSVRERFRLERINSERKAWQD
ncbi:hypothetical protein Dimus_013111 [Dionaea muscipula]